MSISYEEKRIINTLKMIAIIMVVYIHSYSVRNNVNEISKMLLFFEEIVSNGICSSAVSIMFIVSGYLSLLNKHSVFEMYRKKIISLVIPYILWNTLWIILFYFLQNFSATKTFFTSESVVVKSWGVVDWLKAYGISLRFNYPLVYPLWFMRDLIVIFLAWPFIIIFVQKWYRIIVPILLICLFIPLNISIKNSFCYFMIGMGLNKLHFRVYDCQKIKNSYIIPLYILLVVTNTLLNNSIIKIFVILIGCIVYTKLAISLERKIKENTIASLIKNEIFLIYVFHELTLTCFKKVCYRILPQVQLFQWIEYIFLPILIIFITCVLGCLLKWIFPEIYTAVTGNRKSI